jgi:hypothetical protein
MSGTLGDVVDDNYFKVTVSNNAVVIKDGSLCKYYLGDNFKTLARNDTEMGIEKISDTLHLPIEKSRVTRLDFAQNFIVSHPVEIYYNHLGELSGFMRQAVTNGTRAPETLYYSSKSNGNLIFYDKTKKQGSKRRPIPEPYQDRYVLRYEQSYKKRVAKAFGVKYITAEMLYDEQFYTRCLDIWGNNYFSIRKINDITLNFNMIKGIKDLYTLGTLLLVKEIGGELAFTAQINEARKDGRLSNKQACDIRRAIIKACDEKVDVTTKNECILELDRKVKEAVWLYR